MYHRYTPEQAVAHVQAAGFDARAAQGRLFVRRYGFDEVWVDADLRGFFWSDAISRALKIASEVMMVDLQQKIKEETALWSKNAPTPTHASPSPVFTMISVTKNTTPTPA